MKTIRPFLFLVFAGMLGSLCAQTNTNPLTVYITYFNTHVQNYAVVDLSGTNAATNVNLIALDDSNNIAFGYFNTAITAYDVYTWTNGVLTTQTPLTLNQIDEFGDTNGYLPTTLLANGEIFGEGSGGVPDLAPAGNDIAPFYATGNTASFIALPIPYVNAGLVYYGNGGPLAVASDGSYALFSTYDIIPTFLDSAGITNFDSVDPVIPGISWASFIVTRNSANSFDAQEGGRWGYFTNSTSTTINASEVFSISAINKNGWGIGFGNSYYWNPGDTNNSPDDPNNAVTNTTLGYQIWDGKRFYSLNGGSNVTTNLVIVPSDATNGDEPINLNDSNQVIVQGYDTNGDDTEGYIWHETPITNSGVITTNALTTTLKSLIPSTNVQAQIQNIQPFAISNIRQTNSGSATKLPILNILCLANVRTYAGLTTVTAGKTNSQPSITNSEIILFSQYADQTWHFKQVFGLDYIDIQQINANGLVTALGDTNPTALQKPLLAIPLSLSNIDDPTVRNGGNGTNNIDITFMTNAGIGTNNFKYRDTNINCVAWIAGNDPTNNNAPRMPWLQAQALGFTNVNTYWKLQVTFHDRFGNPHRDFDTGDTNDANTNAIAQDVVNIPAQSNTLDTNVVNGWVQITNGTWNIYQDKDWTNAVAQGFFGGDATLSLMISNSNGATILPPQNFYFRIAGENPDTNLCKTYITNNCGPYWYAYAIAKEETEGDGSHHYYNHFMDNGGTLTNHATPWPGHEGRPSWNDDGIPDATTGSGGYGLMQQTYGTNEANYIMPRSWIWNWQANLAGFTNEIYSKEVDYVTNNGIVTNMAIASRKYNILVGWNPTLATHIWCPAKGATKGAFSSYQTVLIGVYNGNKGFSRVYPNDNLYPKGIKSPWDSQWKLTATYPPKVASKLETNTPSQ